MCNNIESLGESALKSHMKGGEVHKTAVSTQSVVMSAFLLKINCVCCDERL